MLLPTARCSASPLNGLLPKAMREFEWIARYFAPLACPDASLNLRDDAALLSLPEGQQLVITTDTLNEGIHFLPHTPPDRLAHKALAVNLSDLAAMGAQAHAYSLALSLPCHTDEAWIAGFAAGLAAMQSTHKVQLIGGDTTATDGPLSITISAYGLCPAGQALTRKGAKSGDLICVSGTIGDAVIGLQMARENVSHPLRARYEQPEPRLTLGVALRGIASACMDISDGLVQDVGQLSNASGVGAVLYAAQIPLHTTAIEWIAHERITLAELMGGGDDYELLFTLPPLAKPDLPFTVIGAIEAGEGVRVLDAAGTIMPLTKGGYSHF